MSGSRNTAYLFGIIFLSFFVRLFFNSHHDLLAEEAYYWNYATHLDWGYLDHPPLVAIVIKVSTGLFGLTEFGVRAPAILCWLITAYYSYRWCELTHKHSGVYAVLLLSILPYFFLYSLIITPDLPLIACWSAALYYLYRVLCCNQASDWYKAGIAVGLGLLAKYTMVLLVATTGLYMLTVPSARFWFGRKQPYIALAIMLVLFSPVIYWNATHDWMSFAFQSTRRMESAFRFSLHELLALLLCFLTPVGIYGLYKLLKRYDIVDMHLPKTSIQFFQWYALVPLLVFGLFSITHDIKCNWIGPSILALLPWLSLLAQQKISTLQRWFITSIPLLAAYMLVLCCVTFGKPEVINQLWFSKMISWNNLTSQFSRIAIQVTPANEQPVLIPLDSYSIASELLFYQAKQSQTHPKSHPFRVLSADHFGYNGLMFHYWHPLEDMHHKTVILIGKTPDAFHVTQNDGIKVLSPITMIWGRSQGTFSNLREYYYQVVSITL